MEKVYIEMYRNSEDRPAVTLALDESDCGGVLTVARALAGAIPDLGKIGGGAHEVSTDFVWDVHPIFHNSTLKLLQDMKETDVREWDGAEFYRMHVGTSGFRITCNVIDANGMAYGASSPYIRFDEFEFARCHPCQVSIGYNNGIERMLALKFIGALAMGYPGGA